jgi:hypothetical protein
MKTSEAEMQEAQRTVEVEEVCKPNQKRGSSLRRKRKSANALYSRERVLQSSKNDFPLHLNQQLTLEHREAIVNNPITLSHSPNAEADNQI